MQQTVLGLSKDEFFKLYRFVNQLLTPDEFELEWDEYQKHKAEHLKQKTVQ